MIALALSGNQDVAGKAAATANLARLAGQSGLPTPVYAFDRHRATICQAQVKATYENRVSVFAEGSQEIPK